MTENQITQLRAVILMQLSAAGSTGLAFDLIYQGAKLAGLGTITPGDVQTQLTYLTQDLGHASQSGNPMNTASKIYRLTEKGRVALVEAGLIHP